MTPFTSDLPSPPFEVQFPQQRVPLKNATPSQHLDQPHPPKERTIDIFVSFKLRHITAEFPAVSPVYDKASPDQTTFMCTGLGPAGTQGFPSAFSLH